MRDNNLDHKILRHFMFVYFLNFDNWTCLKMKGKGRNIQQILYYNKNVVVRTSC